MDWCTQCYIFRRTNEPTGAWPDGVHLGLLPEGGEPASYEAEGKHRNPRSTGQRAGPSSDDAIACKQPETLRIRSRMRRQPTADSHQCAGKPNPISILCPTNPTTGGIFRAAQLTKSQNRLTKPSATFCLPTPNLPVKRVPLWRSVWGRTGSSPPFGPNEVGMGS